MTTLVRELDLETIEIAKGDHPNHDAMCVMEAVAYVAGEEWTDHPKCACPVIAAFMRRWNDDLDDATRQKLKPYIPRLVGTKSTPEVESKRAWLATDWLCRVHLPAWLELAGLKEQAEAVRNLPPIVSTDAAKSAQPTLNVAREKSAAARDAAWDAARAAAWDAARAAAWDTARAAAWDTARAAARDAAWDAARAAAWDAARAAAWDTARAAAWDAAWAAARKKLLPTKTSLQASAFDLLDRMIETKE